MTIHMIARAYETKLNPSEPWRYSCINCDSVALDVRKDSTRSQTGLVRCRKCGNMFKEVWDKKKRVRCDVTEAKKNA